jgi:hypothetical protein
MAYEELFIPEVRSVDSITKKLAAPIRLKTWDLFIITSPLLIFGT